MTNIRLPDMASLPEQFRNDDRVELFCSLVAPGVPADVVALVYHYAADLGLDPLRREVMPVATRVKDESGAWTTSYNIIVGVHGVLKVLGREPDYAGLLSAVVYPGERCIIRADGTVQHEYDPVARAEANASAPNEAGIQRSTALLPVGAWATITRILHGAERRFTSYVPFSQVAQVSQYWEDVPGSNRKQQVTKLRAVWAQRPDWMTEKCAVGAVARKAYDHRLGRVYVPEEFGAVSAEGGSIAVPVDDEGAAPLVQGQRQLPASGAVERLQRDTGLSREAAESIARGEATSRMRAALAAAEQVFADPPRAFVRQTPSGMWANDAELLQRLQQNGPVLVDKAPLELIERITNEVKLMTEEASNGNA